MAMQWEVDRRTVRDCPGGRTEDEWREAIRSLEKSVQGVSHCHACGQELHAAKKYRVTETEEWLPSECDLPRGRWALSASACTLAGAKKLKAFMGSRATIYVMAKHENSATYKLLSEASPK